MFSLVNLLMLHKSPKSRCVGVDRLMLGCYYWGTVGLNRDYPVVRNCAATAQINDFRSVFLLARISLRVWPNVWHGRVGFLSGSSDLLFLEFSFVSVATTLRDSETFFFFFASFIWSLRLCVYARRRSLSVWSGNLLFSRRLQRRLGGLPAILTWVAKSWRSRGRLLIWMHLRSSRKSRTPSMSIGSALERSLHRGRHLSSKVLVHLELYQSHICWLFSDHWCVLRVIKKNILNKNNNNLAVPI